MIEYEIVDLDDKVIGTATHADLIAKNHRYRSVRILLFQNNNVLMHLRSHAVSYPNKWSVSAAGFVKAGETYAQAAQREVVEELGVHVKLHEIAKLQLTNAPYNTNLRIYCGRIHDQLIAPSDAVAKVKWFTKEELIHALAKDPESFTKNAREFCERYLIPHFDWYATLHWD